MVIHYTDHATTNGHIVLRDWWKGAIHYYRRQITKLNHRLAASINICCNTSTARQLEFPQWYYGQHDYNNLMISSAPDMSDSTIAATTKLTLTTLPLEIKHVIGSKLLPETRSIELLDTITTTHLNKILIPLSQTSKRTRSELLSWFQNAAKVYEYTHIARFGDVRLDRLEFTMTALNFTMRCLDVIPTPTTPLGSVYGDFYIVHGCIEHPCQGHLLQRMCEWPREDLSPIRQLRVTTHIDSKNDLRINHNTEFMTFVATTPNLEFLDIYLYLNLTKKMIEDWNWMWDRKGSEDGEERGPYIPIGGTAFVPLLIDCVRRTAMVKARPRTNISVTDTKEVGPNASSEVIVKRA